jgi:hypothetical protein
MNSCSESVETPSVPQSRFLQTPHTNTLRGFISFRVEELTWRQITLSPVVRVLKLSEGGSSYGLPVIKTCTIIWFCRAMALKALDQRLANPANATSSAQSASPLNPESMKNADEDEGGDLGSAGRASR